MLNAGAQNGGIGSLMIVKAGPVNYKIFYSPTEELGSILDQLGVEQEEFNPNTGKMRRFRLIKLVNYWPRAVDLSAGADLSQLEPQFEIIDLDDLNWKPDFVSPSVMTPV